MSNAGLSSEQSGSNEERLQEFDHPRGTLVIVVLFGLLFGLGWFAMYVFRFLGRGAPHS